MQSFPECIPCIIKQVLNTTRLITDDDDTQRKVLMEAMKVMQRADYSRAAAEISYHALIRVCNLLGSLDPYREAKLHYNKLVLDSIAVAGNIIDLGIFGEGSFDFRQTVRRAVEDGLAVDHFAELKEAMEKGHSILYILDNCGEVVFDRLLIEKMLDAGKEVCCVVRKSPILNDVTRIEAEEVGITQLCPIRDSGCDIFGVPMDLVSDDFHDAFYAADVVISKGTSTGRCFSY